MCIRDRNSNRIHSVGIAELLLLSQSRTSHTSLLVELVEEVLEGNRSQSLAPGSYTHLDVYKRQQAHCRLRLFISNLQFLLQNLNNVHSVSILVCFFLSALCSRQDMLPL